MLDAKVEAYRNCLAELRAAGAPNIDANQARAIVRRVMPTLEDVFFLEGLAACLKAQYRRKHQPMDPAARARLAKAARQTKADKAYCRAHRIHFSELASHRAKRAVVAIKDNAAKAAKYDKVVDMLDTWMVGDLRLGECSKAVLLAESARCETASATLASQGAVYARLAHHLKDNETVRTSTKREAVLDILLALKSDD